MYYSFETLQTSTFNSTVKALFCSFQMNKTKQKAKRLKNCQFLSIFMKRLLCIKYVVVKSSWSSAGVVNSRVGGVGVVAGVLLQLFYWSQSGVLLQILGWSSEQSLLRFLSEYRGFVNLSRISLAKQPKRIVKDFRTLCTNALCIRVKQIQ